MISAKKLANEMADAIHIDSNLFRAFLGGFVNLPVDFCYLGRDFLDTENRTIHSYDKERMIKMIKSGMASRQNLEKVIRLFVDNFIQRVDFQKVKELSTKAGGHFLGKMAFNQLAAANMGYILSSKLIPRLASGMAIGSLLSVGAAMSRSVYVSRNLMTRNPSAYNMLRRMGDLDLLYLWLPKKPDPLKMPSRYPLQITTNSIKHAVIFLRELIYEESITGRIFTNNPGDWYWRMWAIINLYGMVFIFLLQ